MNHDEPTLEISSQEVKKAKKTAVGLYLSFVIGKSERPDGHARSKVVVFFPPLFLVTVCLDTSA